MVGRYDKSMSAGQAKAETIKGFESRFWSGLDFDRFAAEEVQTMACSTIGNRNDYFFQGVIAKEITPKEKDLPLEDNYLDFRLFTDAVKQVYVSTVNTKPDSNTPHVCEVGVAELQDQASGIIHNRYIMVLHKDFAPDSTAFAPKMTYYGILTVVSLNNAFLPKIILKDFKTDNTHEVLKTGGIWENQTERSMLEAWATETPIESSGKGGKTLGAQGAEFGRMLVDGAIISIAPIAGIQTVDAGISQYTNISKHLLTGTKISHRVADWLKM